jgi:hypothetical protein
MSGTGESFFDVFDPFDHFLGDLVRYFTVFVQSIKSEDSILNRMHLEQLAMFIHKTSKVGKLLLLILNGTSQHFQPIMGEKII